MGLTQGKVSELYVSIFGRASEGEGNTYWQKQTNTKVAADAMLATTAAKDYFGTTLNDNQAFIEFIYENTLNKTVNDDPNGVAYWVGLLNSGVSKGSIVSSMINAINTYAPGGVNYDANDTATVNAYNQFANRVEVSNYMAKTVTKAPSDWATSTSFNGTLKVTYENSTLESSKNDIDDIATIQTPVVDTKSAIYHKTWSIQDTAYYDLGNNLLFEVNYDTDNNGNPKNNYYISNYTVEGNIYHLVGLQGDNMDLTINNLSVGSDLTAVGITENFTDTVKITSVGEIELNGTWDAQLFDITGLNAAEYVASSNNHQMSNDLILKLYTGDYHLYNLVDNSVVGAGTVKDDAIYLAYETDGALELVIYDNKTDIASGYYLGEIA